jgi:hypothetical protein
MAGTEQGTLSRQTVAKMANILGIIESLSRYRADDPFYAESLATPRDGNE